MQHCEVGIDLVQALGDIVQCHCESVGGQGVIRVLLASEGAPLSQSHPTPHTEAPSSSPTAIAAALTPVDLGAPTAQTARLKQKTK